MIKKLFTAALIACAIGTQAQQVQNPGFENWTGAYPTSWGSFSEMLAGLGVAGTGLETQTTQMNSGSFAVLMESKSIAALGGQILPGVVNTGAITYSGAINLGFQPYASQPTSYSFYCKYTPAGTGDTAFSQAILTKWNGTSRDTLAYGGILVDVALASYTQVSVPITWFTVAVPDSIQLTFASSAMATVPVGSQFFVDDVNMILSTGVQSLNADGSFSQVYPNPAVNHITFATGNENAKYAKVYDLTGRAVTTIELTGKITKVDVSTFENGMYIYVITDANNNKLSTSKFNVAK